MKTRYHENKERAKYRNTDPTMTDQASANETDVNVIVKRFTISGQAPGTTKEATFADFTELPDNLRDMIEAGRSLQREMSKLPAALKELTVDELLALTPEAMKNKLTPPVPPAPPADPPADPKKETIK